LAGLFPGCLAAGVAWLAAQVDFSPLLESVLVLLAWHFGTGFIHVDGLMDTSDALFPGPAGTSVWPFSKIPMSVLLP